MLSYVTTFQDWEKCECDEDYIAFYARAWNIFVDLVKFLTHTFAYMNRQWISQVLDAGNGRFHFVEMVRWHSYRRQGLMLTNP